MLIVNTNIPIQIVAFWIVEIADWIFYNTDTVCRFGQNENFSQKKGSAIFLPLLLPNFMPSFRKILGAFSEINCATYRQTD